MRLFHRFAFILALLAGLTGGMECASAQEHIIARGIQVLTNGNMPETGSIAPDFTGTAKDMNDISLSSFKGRYVVLNIFPSLDTPTCAASVRNFNKVVASMDNTVVLCISKDLPFAQSRFCSAEGIENVLPLSLFRSPYFDRNYGLIIEEGPMKGLTARAVFVIDPDGKIIYRQLVSDISEEPDYDKAIGSIC